MFDYERKSDSIEEELNQVCNEVQFDVAMIDILNRNTPLMDKEQKKTVLQQLQNIKLGISSIFLNHASITDPGVEILAEGMKYSTSVIKLDLDSNLFMFKACTKLSDMLKINKYL